MLNNIKISQTTNEIILNVNVIAEINEILEELQSKLPRLRDFYQTSTIPMRVTGRLFTESEIKKVKAAIIVPNPRDQSVLKIKVSTTHRMTRIISIF